MAREISISDAEWQVMNVIWDGQPMTSQEIVGELQRQSDWAPATIKTMLHRLARKKILAFEQRGNRYLYKSRVRRSDCIRKASRSFLQRVFGGETGPLLAHFLRTSRLSTEEIAELRTILDEQEARE